MSDLLEAWESGPKNYKNTGPVTYDYFPNKEEHTDWWTKADKFVTEFTKAVVKGWKGLTLEHLETLLLIDMTGKDGSEELDYTSDNAETLVSSSTEFDTWLNEVVFDLDNFRTGSEGTTVQKTGKVLPK